MNVYPPGLPDGDQPTTTRIGCTVTCTCHHTCSYATPAEAADRRWHHALREHAPWNRRPSRQVRPAVPHPVGPRPGPVPSYS